MEMENKIKNDLNKKSKDDKALKLGDIKSLNVYKKIFSFFDERKKLDLLKYNKNYQKKMGIKLENYKKLSGRYKLKGINGYGEEYILNTDILIFQGEYQNKKRNGIGKEYNEEGVLIYEGEFLKGKRNRKGKEYNDQGELIFNGSFYNGKRWIGYGKDYDTIDFDGESLIYEGYYSNGQRNGKGKEYESRNIKLIDTEPRQDYKIKFEGEYLKGKRWNGKGYNFKGEILYEIKEGNGNAKVIITKRYDHYFLYEGEFKNGILEKNKHYEFIRGPNQDIKLFEGEYLNGKIWNGNWYETNGQLKYQIKEGQGKGEEDEPFDHYMLKYKGEYINGERNGKGIEYGLFAKYEGEFLNGKKNGKGQEYLFNQIIFEGEYFNDMRWKGMEYIDRDQDWDYGITIEIEYLNGKKWNGVGYNDDGELIFLLINGNGTIIEYNYYDYTKYIGEYLNGRKNGKGKEYKKWIDFSGCYCDSCVKDGSYCLIFEGEYLNGKRYKGKEYHYYTYQDPEIHWIYEGDYLNGKKYNGTLKEYKGMESKTNVFEGEYINGKLFRYEENYENLEDYEDDYNYYEENHNDYYDKIDIKSKKYKKKKK